ncbi:MAG: NUDIX hydrolase [Firmicutes bacterium]|nr:NUDIX hydrolase [Bacillota bacterium]
MRFLGLNKLQQGRFVTRYDLRYQTAAGREKVYEMISRQPDIDGQRGLWDHPADAVIMILTDAAGERLLLLKEFRMAAGEPVYNFPAGLIEPGESVEEAARRELAEETGLTLTSVRQILPASYNAVGFSNEKNACLLGTAAGEFRASSSDEEEISCGWYGKEELRRLLASAAFESRTQLYGSLWANGEVTAKGDQP